jgi:hypothetical protein
MQVPAALQEVVAWQTPLTMVYPATQPVHAVGLPEQLEQGGKQYSWHMKFWFRNHPSPQDMQPSVEQLVQPDPQLVGLVTQVLLLLSIHPGAHWAQVVRELGEHTWHPMAQGTQPAEVRV